MQKKSSAPAGIKAVIGAVLFLAVLIVLSCFGYLQTQGTKLYYVIACAIIAAACVPFFVSFEKKKPSARELAVVASLAALAVASRAAFYALPSVKPMCAIVMVAAVALGAQTGFITGAVAMFASNFIFGHGPWTIFQMLAMGACGLIAGLVFHNRKIRKNRFVLAFAGGMINLVFYSLIVDLNWVLMSLSNPSLKGIISVYAAAMPMNAVHAATTAAVLAVAGPSFIDMTERIRFKYGIFTN